MTWNLKDRSVPSVTEEVVCNSVVQKLMEWQTKIYIYIWMKESGGQVLPLSPSWQFLLHLCQSLWLQSCWITDPHHYCKVSVLSSPYHKTNVPNNTCSYSLILSTQNRADDGCLLIITSLKLTRSSSLYSQSPTTTTSHPPNPRSPADQPSNNVSIDLPRYPLLLSACIIKKK